VECQIELLNLICIDLTNLKHIIRKGGKNYFITFLNYYSGYTKVYLNKDKDEVDIFLTYKTKVENQLNKKN